MSAKRVHGHTFMRGTAGPSSFFSNHAVFSIPIPIAIPIGSGLGIGIDAILWLTKVFRPFAIFFMQLRGLYLIEAANSDIQW
jgi:hypothetical protein